MIDVDALPQMTHLQFAIAERIPTGGIFALHLIEKTGLTGPRFYQAMKRMISAGWVAAEDKPVYGTRCGTFYTLTKAGADEGDYSITFYKGWPVKLQRKKGA